MKIPLHFAIVAALTFTAVQAEDMDAGAAKKMYSEVCKNCHGPTGQGMASFPRLAGRDQDYIASRLRQYRAGEKVGPNSPLMMPHAKDLSDDEIANLAAYISQSLK